MLLMQFITPTHQPSTFKTKLFATIHPVEKAHQTSTVVVEPSLKFARVALKLSPGQGRKTDAADGDTAAAWESLLLEQILLMRRKRIKIM